MKSRWIARTAALLIGVLPFSGCVSLISAQKTPMPGGKEKVQLGLLGFNFDDPAITSIIGSQGGPDTIQLLKLFSFTRDRKLTDHDARMLRKLQEIDAMMGREQGDKPVLDYIQEGNQIMDTLKKDTKPKPEKTGQRPATNFGRN